MKSSWQRTLERSLGNERCVALDSGGHQCRKQATAVYYYHGDGEIYDYNGSKPQWVRAAFCCDHGGK